MSGTRSTTSWRRAAGRKDRFTREYEDASAGSAVLADSVQGIPRAAPPNDDCASAIDVGMLPAVLQGDTTEATDDSGVFVGTCGTAITAPGVWYTVTGTGNTITASLCTNTFYDSRINVFCNDCADLICVGGNDDFCGLQSEISWCSEAGTTYYILVQGFSGQTGAFELTVSDDATPCLDPPVCEPQMGPPNDLCDNAEDLGPLPATVVGTTVGATPDTSVAPECGTTVTAPGVWYSFVGTGSQTTASLCAGTDYDSKISVYSATCDALTCVVGNDDFCGLQSEVSFCAELGVTYYVLVHGFSSNAGNFTLDVFDTGIPCECPDVCQVGDTPEGEPDCFDEYVDATNGGCNSDPPVFGSISCGESVCGTSGNFLFTDPEFGTIESRDTDWYKLVLTGAQFVTVTLESNFEGLVGIVDTGGVDDCAAATDFLVSEVTARCVPTSVVANLGAGTWYVFVSTADFTGTPCGSEYRVTVECAPPITEACCFPNGTCVDLLADDCVAQGGEPQGLGAVCETTTCPVIPDNDLCENAELIPTVPGSVFGTTIDATTDSFDLDCPGAIITSPGVWYTVTGTGNTMTASFCDGSIPVDVESKLSIYCGPSCDELFCVDAFTISDPAGCSADPQSVSWCSRPGETYYILVHGFGGSTFDFELVVTDDGAACDDPPNCEPCTYTCQDPNSLPEGEPTCADEYDDMFNGGCNSAIPVFSDIVCGDKICGESGTFIFTDPVDGPLNFRDTDWYRFTLAERSLVTIEFIGGFEGLVGVVDTGGIDDCAGATGFLFSDTGGECETLTVAGAVEPGTWYLFVAPSGFDGVPCGTPYEVSLTCEPLGGCCLPDPAVRAPCIETTEAQCMELFGIYLGDGASCSSFAYVDATCGNAFEDISATGVATGIGDEEELLVPIGFNFSLYGSPHADVYISDNGYLSFDLVTGLSFLNQDIPDPGNPNNVIAPMWDDLDPSAAGEIYYETRGTMPTRRFIVQWDGVPQYLDVDANTFQVVLYEGTNCIEFRYLAVTPEGFTGDYTIGVENQDGTDAVSLPGTVAVDGACIELCPLVGEDPCPRCIGDINGDGKVDIFDAAVLLPNFGKAVPPNTGGDLDGDGLVTIYDFSVLSADFSCGTLDPM